MSSREKQYDPPNPLDWLEEGYRCLRNAPARVVLLYYIGSIPFWIGFLFFWAEMSRGALPRQVAIEWALLVAVLYAWMKLWQALYMHRLREAFLGIPPERMGFRRVLRAAPAQVAIHGAGLLALIPALVLIFPLVTVSTFLQNASAYAYREEGIKAIFRTAAGKTFYQMRDQHLAAGLLWLFGAFVFGNFLFAVYLFPEIARILLGLESQFYRGGWQGTNTTIMTAVIGATYLVLNPFWKTVCLLRCFHCESRATGEDLRVKTRHLRARSTVALLVAGLFIGFLAVSPEVRADESTPERPPAAQVDPDRLEVEIERVLEHREYARWIHEMRDTEEEAEREPGIVGSMVQAVIRWVVNFLRWLGEVADWLIERLIDWLSRDEIDPQTQERQPRDWTDFLRMVLVVLAVVLTAIVAFMIWRVWRQRRKPIIEEEAASGGGKGDESDLERETVRPDSRTLDEWSSLAEELKAKGELRLALRALYLASLSQLSEEGVLTAAVGKSNREYEMELRRRAHDQAERIAAFSANCRIYERAWYGMYPVDDDMYSKFEENLEEIRRSVQVAGS